jgi:pimeloyl-ACP methyl ester carboxylesterase
VPAIARGVAQLVLYVNSSRLERSADEVRAVVPHAQFAQVVGSGHFVQLEVPDQLNAMLDAFLKSL